MWQRNNHGSHGGDRLMRRWREGIGRRVQDSRGAAFRCAFMVVVLVVPILVSEGAPSAQTRPAPVAEARPTGQEPAVIIERSPIAVDVPLLRQTFASVVVGRVGVRLNLGQGFDVVPKQVDIFRAKQGAEGSGETPVRLDGDVATFGKVAFGEREVGWFAMNTYGDLLALTVSNGRDTFEVRSVAGGGYELLRLAGERFTVPSRLSVNSFELRSNGSGPAGPSRAT